VFKTHILMCVNGFAYGGNVEHSGTCHYMTIISWY